MINNDENIERGLANLVHPGLNINGEVGIEVEVEGANLPVKIGGGGIWKATKDNSLRGESMEYIFNGPKPRDNVDKYVDALWSVFRVNNSILNVSHRTSVHVHLNVSNLRVYDVVNIFTLYSIVEDFLIPFCGPQRAGNLFCLRMKDAQYVIKKFKDCILNYCFFRLGGDDIRYSGLNLDACRKYGSVEFRAMRGLTEPELVKQWVSILLEIKDAAVERFNSPREMVEQVSMLGAEGFLRSIFSENNFDTLFKYFNEANPDSSIQEVCYQGSRLMQEFAYTLDRHITRARAMAREGVFQVEPPKKMEMRWNVEPGQIDWDDVPRDLRAFEAQARGNAIPVAAMDDFEEPHDDDDDFEDDIDREEEEDEE